MAERKIDIMNAHIAEVTECPICGDKISDNRLLPCGHTFCLKCLEQYNRTIKSKGKSLACHVCRKEFSIPVGGCSMFPKNAMVDKILGIESKQGRNESDTEQCVLCVKGKKAIATVHCIQCDQSLCGDCKRTHSKLKTCLTHHFIPLSKTSHLGDYTSKSYCDNHPKHVLELMCNDCNKPICSKCRSLTHQSHTLADVGELADSYSEQLQSNIEEISQRLSNMDKLSEDIKDQEKQTQENFDKEKERVSKTAADLIRCIVANEDKLIEQLSFNMKRNLKALQPYKLQVESHSDLLRQHKISVEHLKESRNIWGILRSAGEFNKKTSGLLSSDLITINKNKLTLPSLTELQIQSHLIGTNSIYEDSTLSRLLPGCPSAASAAENAEESLEDSSDRNRPTTTDEYMDSLQAEEEMAKKNRVKKRPVALPKKAQLQAGCQKQSDTNVVRQKPTAVDIGSSVLEHACSLESTRDSLSSEDYLGFRVAGSSVLEHACSLENTRDSLSNEDYLGLRAADTITSTVCPSEIYMNVHFQSQIGQDCEENQYETVSEFIANWKSSSSSLKGSSGSPQFGSSSAVTDSENRKWPPAESNDRTASPINATKNVFQAEVEMAMENRVKKRPIALPKKAQLQVGCQKQSDTDVMKQQPTAIATRSRVLHRVCSLETAHAESSVSLSDVYANAHLQNQSQQNGYANLSDAVRDVKTNWSGSLPSRKGH